MSERIVSPCSRVIDMARPAFKTFHTTADAGMANRRAGGYPPMTDIRSDSPESQAMQDLIYRHFTNANALATGFATAIGMDDRLERTIAFTSRWGGVALLSVAVAAIGVAIF